MASGPGQIVLQPQVAYIAVPTAGAFGPVTVVPLTNPPYFTITTGTPTPPSGANLLSADRPTLLTRWDIVRFYIPVLAYSNSASDDSATAKIQAQLIRNGNSVWQGDTGDTQLTSFQVPTGTDPFWFGLITDDLVNPIRIKRGDALSLRVGIQTSPASVGILNVQVGVSFSAAGLSSYKADPTIIDYEVSDVPGVMSL